MRYNNMLARYTSRPTNLRKRLTDTNSVISGSFALEFASGQRNWTAGDLDIYTTEDHLDSIREFFEVDGFKMHEKEDAQDDKTYYIPGISRVVTLKRRQKSIDLVISREDCALAPITFFWNTFLFSFLAGDHYCCAYPVDTFKNKGYITPHWRTNASLEILKSKYENRGWHSLSRDEPHPPLQLQTPRSRRFGDSECMVVAFERGTVPSCEIFYTAVETVGAAWEI